ncbi:MAG: lipid-A-disaccharide synthase [Waddliaceae bacterium]
MTQRLFIFAGEKSGDLLGSFLLEALKKSFSVSSIEGVCGPEMRKQGIASPFRAEDFEMHGLSDILGSISKLVKQFKEVKSYLLQTKPDAIVFIDYPGFNLRMAKSLRKFGYTGKLIQYVSPTVWAWGSRRIHHMANTLDLLMTVYPFEQEFFARTSLPVEYVGNPINEIIQKHRYDSDWAGLLGIKDKNKKDLIGIFPGSRKKEIQNNLPYQLKAAEMLKKEDPRLSFAISCAHEKTIPFMYPILRNNSLKFNEDIFLVPKVYSYELMRDCHSAIAKAGTVTLELALHHRPTAVIYKLSSLNRLFARFILRLHLPHYCIVNILNKKTVFPELIEKGLSAKNLYRLMKSLHGETETRRACMEECRKLSILLQENDASERAAQLILELIA